MRIRVTTGRTVHEATVLDNETARDFVSLLPLTVTMDDLFGKEKYGRLPRPLANGPAQHVYEVGDIAVWPPGPDVVVYYRQDGQPIPSPGIVILGKIDSLGDTLANADGAVEVTFEAIG